MNKLIILAHPSSQGHARALAQTYQQASLDQGHQVQFIDLYHEPRQDFLNFENVKEPVVDQIRDKYHQQILWANEISFFMPMWWFNPPAIMKNFIDNNFNSQFAFKYVGSRPVGLLKGRSARTYMTCDGPAFLYYLILLPFRISWDLTLRFCGLKVLNYTLLSKVRARSAEEKDKWHKSLKKLA